MKKSQKPEELKFETGMSEHNLRCLNGFLKQLDAEWQEQAKTIERFDKKIELAFKGCKHISLELK